MESLWETPEAEAGTTFWAILIRSTLTGLMGEKWSLIELVFLLSYRTECESEKRLERVVTLSIKAKRRLFTKQRKREGKNRIQIFFFKVRRKKELMMRKMPELTFKTVVVKVSLQHLTVPIQIR